VQKSFTKKIINKTAVSETKRRGTILLPLNWQQNSKSLIPGEEGVKENFVGRETDVQVRPGLNSASKRTEGDTSDGVRGSPLRDAHFQEGKRKDNNGRTGWSRRIWKRKDEGGKTRKKKREGAKIILNFEKSTRQPDRLRGKRTEMALGTQEPTSEINKAGSKAKVYLCTLRNTTERGKIG